MTMVPQRRMNADEFLAWAIGRGETEHYELVGGEVVAMAPERASHARMKGLIYLRLTAAIQAAGLPCEVYPDGMAVQVDEHTIYQPDALVRCGDPLDGNTIKIHDPLIVVEVLSPSTQGTDTGNKLADYFRIPSLRHYLMVRPSDGRVVQHTRGPDGDVATRICVSDPITLAPPGITITDLAEAP